MNSKSSFVIICLVFAIYFKPDRMVFVYAKSSQNLIKNKHLNIKTSPKNGQQKVLLVSIDGYRWDLNRITKTPNIDRLMEHGVTVDHVLNVFPTKTLPNHHSIVTGLYPENHGIVNNAFMETKNGLRFDMENRECMEKSSWWNQSVPIWIDVQRKSKSKSGCMFWPGHRVQYGKHGETCKYKPSRILRQIYNKLAVKEADVTYDIITGEAIRWLKKEDVSFVSMYIEVLDSLLHEHGVEHDLISDGMKLIDKFVGRIYKKITKDTSLKDIVNVIFIGDHGHITTSFDRVIDINDFIDVKNDVTAIYGFTDVFIYTKPEKKNRVYWALKKASAIEKRFQVFLKENLPNNMHLKKSSRTGDILVLPAPGWIMGDKPNFPPHLKNGNWTRAEHGYDNLIKDMNPGFFAFGPMFRKGFKKYYIETVDIYSLMCHILGFEPSKHDGSFERVKPFLKEFAEDEDKAKRNKRLEEKEDKKN